MHGCGRAGREGLPLSAIIHLVIDVKWTWGGGGGGGGGGGATANEYKNWMTKLCRSFGSLD